jgi:hypothetical protein
MGKATLTGFDRLCLGGVRLDFTARRFSGVFRFMIVIQAAFGFCYMPGNAAGGEALLREMRRLDL